MTHEVKVKSLLEAHAHSSLTGARGQREALDLSRKALPGDKALIFSSEVDSSRPSHFPKAEFLNRPIGTGTLCLHTSRL